MARGPLTPRSVADRGRRRFGNLVDMAMDVGWSSLHDLIALASAMLSFTLLGRALGPEGFGAYAAIFGITGPLGALIWAGVTLAVLQRALREQDDPSEVASRFTTLTVVQAVVFGALGLWLGAVVIPLPLPTLAAFFVGELLIYGIIRTTVAVVQAVEGFAAASKINIGSQVLRIALLLALYATDRLTVAMLGLTWLLSQVGFAWWVVSRRLPRSGVELRVAAPGRVYLFTAGQLSLPNLATNIRSRGDQTVLVASGHDADAGLYAAAFRIVSLALTPINSANNALFQRFLDHDDNARGQHVRRSRKQAMVAVAAATVIGAVMFVAAPLSTILIGDEFEDSISIIRWLLLFLPLAAASPTASNGLLGLGKVVPRALVVISSAVISLTLYLVLIPFHSWKGAVIGTVVGELWLGVLSWTMLLHYQRQHDRKVDRERAVAEVMDDASVDDEATPETVR